MATPQPISQSAPQTQGPPPNNPATPTNDPSQTQDNSPPVEFDVHIQGTADEIQSAIAVLKEAGLDDIATSLEKALSPDPDDQNSPDQLAGEIGAMGSDPHSGM